ncbi:hypothetical protein F5Y04DRAFT_124 [Hypomontagnella monticulosa]|nr:hypothetical protein F5Y04DRAFT_124 [Hypomontagnella monticulosa]
MVPVSVITLLAGLCAVSARSVPNLHLRHPWVSVPDQTPRAMGTGPKGFLTVDDSVQRAKAAQLHSLSSAAGSLEAETGNTYSACLVETSATVADCKAVIDDIRANNGTIQVASGFCLNWWEGSCMGRVCGGNGQEVYSEDSQRIADTMTTSILNTCIYKGKSGAVADCSDLKSTCGTYKYSLQTYSGI